MRFVVTRRNSSSVVSAVFPELCRFWKHLGCFFVICSGVEKNPRRADDFPNNSAEPAGESSPARTARRPRERAGHQLPHLEAAHGFPRFWGALQLNDEKMEKRGRFSRFAPLYSRLHLRVSRVFSVYLLAPDR